MTQTRNNKRRGEKLCKCLDDKLFRALADPCRIALLAYVAAARKPVTVSRAAECCPVDLSVVSRHLKTLRDAGVLRAERRGKEVYYSAPCADLAAMLRDMADAIDACCPADKGIKGSRDKAGGDR